MSMERWSKLAKTSEAKQLVRKRGKKKGEMGKILHDKKTSKKTKRRKRSGMNGVNKRKENLKAKEQGHLGGSDQLGAAHS